MLNELKKKFLPMMKVLMKFLRRSTKGTLSLERTKFQNQNFGSYGTMVYQVQQLLQTITESTVMGTLSR